MEIKDKNKSKETTLTKNPQETKNSSSGKIPNPIIPKNGIPNTNIFSFTMIFNENISRVWTILLDAANIHKIYPQFSNNYNIVKAKNTSTVGSEFHYNWIGVSMLRCKNVQIIDEETRKIIVREVQADIGISYMKTYQLYEITDTNKCLLKVNMKKMLTKVNDQINLESAGEFFKETDINLFYKLKEFIFNSREYLVDRESFILNYGMEKTWELTTDLSLRAKIIPGLGNDFHYQGDPMKEGSFIKYYIPFLNKVVFLMVKKVIKNKKRNKWIYEYETFGSDKNVIKADIQIMLTKINDNRTFVSIIDTFKQRVSKQFRDNFKYNKRNIIKEIMNYLNDKNNLNKLENNINNVNSNENNNGEKKENMKFNLKINNKNNIISNNNIIKNEFKDINFLV